MKPTVIALLVLAPVLALGACHQGKKNSTTASIETDGAQAGACYLTIKSSHENTVTGVATPMAANAMVHDMTMSNGMMNMSEMAGGLPLKGGEKVELKPGGKHLMLTGLTGPLVEGSAVPLTLTFSDTPAMTVQAPVRQPK